MDEEGCTVLGGQAETIIESLKDQYQPGSSSAPRCAWVRSCWRPTRMCSPPRNSRLRCSTVPAARAFRRVKSAELEEILASTSS